MDIQLISWIACLLITCNLTLYGQRDCLIKKYEAQLGIQEKGNNRGKEVEKYQKAAGVKPGMAWCASMVFWCHAECGVKLNIKNPAQARSWFPKDKVIVRYGKELKQPKKGDVIGVGNNKGINHAGFYDRSEDRSYYCIEGNTSEGVARIKRLKRTVIISRWIR